MTSLADKLTHYQLCLAKALALADGGWSRVTLSQVLVEALQNGPVATQRAEVADVMKSVVRLDLRTTSYRLWIFSDERAVLKGPEGEAELIGWVRHRDEAATVWLERYTVPESPAWVTDALLEELVELAEKQLR